MPQKLELTIPDVKSAYIHLNAVFDSTPILHLRAIIDASGRTVRISGKLESSQATYSFKSRGAEWCVHTLINHYMSMNQTRPPIT